MIDERILSRDIVKGSEQCCATIVIWQTRSGLSEQVKCNINDVLIRKVGKADRLESFDVILELSQFRLNLGLVANAKECLEVAEGKSFGVR
jgi:hypothetical protein